MSTVLNFSAAVSAVIAAWYWFKSAGVQTPEKFAAHVIAGSDPMTRPVGGDPLGAVFVGTAHSSDFAVLAEALKVQARLSAVAARWAGGAAVFQCLALCWPLLEAVTLYSMKPS